MSTDAVKEKHTYRRDDEDGWLDMRDSLAGLEICIHRARGCRVECAVIPVEHVPALIKKLVAFSTTGNIAMARDALKEDEKQKAD